MRGVAAAIAGLSMMTIGFLWHSQGGGRIGRLLLSSEKTRAISFQPSARMASRSAEWRQAKSLARQLRKRNLVSYAQQQQRSPVVYHPTLGFSKPLLPSSRQQRAASFSACAAKSGSIEGTTLGDEIKLQQLRTLLEDKKLDAYIVPTADPHQSEYPPNCFARREYISGFTGSAGTAVITRDDACLWTDGRYFLQADDELSSEWKLQKAGLPSTPKISEWLRDSLAPGSHVGIDPLLHTANEVAELEKVLSAKEITVVLEETNLIDGIWQERPSNPTSPLRLHADKWAGESASDKLKKLRDEIRGMGADALLVSKLDDVSWLLNIRGADIECNPVPLAYAIVEMDQVRLFVSSEKVSDVVRGKLEESNVAFYEYDEVIEGVKSVVREGKRIAFDPATTSIGLKNAAKEEKSDSFIERPSPIDMPKATKNEAELAGMREAHLRDGVALAKFFAWMDALTKKGETVSEYVAGAELANFRAEQSGFFEPSFPSIVGEGPNGAVIHYRAAKDTARGIKAGSMLLVDSGGQYECGTTDCTRVYHFGGDAAQPTPFQKEVYTRVLKGHIAVDQSVWPENTPGHVLDAYARRPLWEGGLNYLHGTGHGVGAALNVHEGPQSISPRFTNQTPLKEGMICSNEPGYYEDGQFGVRIENLLIVQPAETKHQFNDGKYLKFERLTHTPIQTKLIDLDLLSESEVAWINTYHQEVWEKISPRLTDEPVALDWLFDHTQPIEKPRPDDDDASAGVGPAAGEDVNGKPIEAATSAA